MTIPMVTLIPYQGLWDQVQIFNYDLQLGIPLNIFNEYFKYLPKSYNPINAV